MGTMSSALVGGCIVPFFTYNGGDGMDRIDRKIIDILQTNARAPLKEIAFELTF